MDVKVFDVRAPGTKTAAIAVKLATGNGTENRIVASAGFGESHVLVATLKPGRNDVTYDKFHWRDGEGGVEQNGMMYLAHDEIERRWDDLTSGDTVDLTGRWGELQEGGRPTGEG